MKLIGQQTNKEVLGLRNLSKVYGTGVAAVRAVDNVNLSVSTGEIVLIMGPSGSGKTTLLSLAGCLIKPTEGEVAIGRQVVSALGETKLPSIRLKKNGFIFQSFNLLSALNVLENVQVVLNFSGAPRREAREKSSNLLTELGLKDRLSHYPNQISGGEKQRVAIARALANDPELILADEPTANLDSKTGHSVVELLKSVAGERGKSIVIVSHDMRIMDIADRVLQLEDGRLSEGAAELSTDPVCKMIVPKSQAVVTTEYQDELYYFCSRKCRDRFVAAPDMFLEKH